MAPYGRGLAAIIQIVGFVDETAAISGRLNFLQATRHPEKARTVCVTANLTVMEHMIGVDKARARLGQLAEQAAASEPVILTRRGERLAVLISPEDYEQLLSERRVHAREKLADRLAAVRQSVTASGLDASVVDEAIAAARALD